MAEEFDECSTALNRATTLISRGADDVRVKFCTGRTMKFSASSLVYSIDDMSLRYFLILLHYSTSIGKTKRFHSRFGDLFSVLN